MSMHRVTFLITLGLLTTHANAQWDLYFDGNIPISRQGQTLGLAWAGGLNSVQVSAIDLNDDQLLDLFLFDRSGNVVVTLLNTGGTGTSMYRISRDYDLVAPIQQLHDWALLRDYNCDGKPDIFSYSQAGFAVYRNISSGDDLAFELATIQAQSNYVSPSGADVFANLFVSQIDLPGIADVDVDGDLDILTFSLLGSYVEYHKNLSQELYQSCDSLVFEVRNKCWGYFAENFSNNSVTLNVPCNFNVPNPEIGGGGEGLMQRGPEAEGAPKAHAGSTLTPLDLNGDDVMDLLIGDVSFNNLVGLHNGGTTMSAIMTEEDTVFPTYDVPVDLPIFPGAFHVDIDGDAKRDLVVSPNATSLCENFESMWYYHNIGTDAAPVFEFQQNDLFQDQMLDLGEGAYPVPFDHDGDGRMDLVVANAGYFASSGTYIGKLALLRNAGSDTAPSFELVTDDYMGLSTSGIGQSMHPAFADLDDDGDLDLYIGDLQGRLHFFRNVTAGSDANFQLIQPNVTDAVGAVIDVGQYATPQFVDLDEDGLMDLIIGERNGNLNHYRNTGSASDPAWTLITENLGGVSTVEWWNVTGHSVPFLFNGPDGDREILLGSESGWLYHYGGIEGNLAGTWTLLDSTFLDRRDGMRTGVCLYDFTGDDELDLVIGNFRGGLSFWRSDLQTGSSDRDVAGQVPFRVFPNPAEGQVGLVWDGPLPAGSTWVFTNSMGQCMLSLPATASTSVIPVDVLAGGVYFVHLEGPTRSTAQRVVLIDTAR